MRLSQDPADWIFASSLGSSNDYLMQGDFPQGTIVLTEEQTAGKGSHGRSWKAEPGAFLFSGLLYQGDRPASVQLLPLCMGIAAALALEEFAGAKLFLKWPNDLMVAHGDGFLKAGGVLVESSNHPRFRIVAGLGLNWTVAPALSGSGALFLDPTQRKEFLGVLIPAINRWVAAERQAIMSAFESRSVFQTHAARYAAKVFPAARVGEEGQLYLYPETGVAVAVGDVRERLEIVAREVS